MKKPIIWENEKRELIKLAGLKQIYTGKREGMNSVLQDLLQLQDKLPYYRDKKN